jgi:hypothetical protein
MTDDLKQLLRNADRSATGPSMTPAELVRRVQRTARHDRRVAVCGLAVLVLAISLAPIAFRHQDQTGLAIRPIPNLKSEISDSLEAALHEKTVAFIESMHQPPRKSTATSDAFLAGLQMERNRAALVLLRDAKRSEDDPITATNALRRTISLFPETPAAADAHKELKEIDSSRSQS